jgi:hypothetical protein
MLHAVVSNAWPALVALGFGGLTAYIDIDSFFRSKRISYTTAFNFFCYFFLALNGGLAAALVIWAIESEPTSVINSIVHLDSVVAKTAAIAFAVPVILRSKLFSFGENQTPAGPALAYDWARLKVLYDVNMRSAIAKDTLSARYAGVWAARPPADKAGLPAALKGMVDPYVAPFATPAERAEMQREFDGINTLHAGATNLTGDHFRQLIRWAMDSTQIGYIKRRLA